MLEVRLIGTFDIKCDGKPVVISSRIAQSLFAYLILNTDTSYRREKLAGMFWPDATEAKARAYLRHELWRLRKDISSNEFLLSDDIGIAFNSSIDYWLDSEALEKLKDTSSTDELMVVLSTYQGELLPGFYDEWIVLEREHLQAVYEQKMARLLESLEKEKCWNDILEWAERWISFGQRPESAYRYLMIAYDALGDRAKVTSTYQRCVQELLQLDLEPSEETRALAFKRKTSLNIPIPLTSFIGREKELEEVAKLFSKSRLITLTGSGGVGKTRLAIQVVADVLELFPDGVWFLDLAPLTDPALVPNTLASLLGLQESGKQPITDLLINYFCSRTALVIFDNCEHVIESSAQLIHSLLTSCEALSILATSREALRVAG
ncbi:MAG TPA: BTAD domain-containing putative transcriptional regulator, partial [Anaerolineales bacterium]|nr:BTAD domain-containing putative transcriptional regulator [Anaerolineales bacterium]